MTTTEQQDDGDLDEGDGPDEEYDPELTARHRKRGVVLVAVVLAVLLVGAAAGMLITLAAVESGAPPSADSVDVGFAQDMQVHHLQAVTMANWARDHTEDLSIKQLAFDMEQTQLGQVGAMSGWLDVWGQPEQNPNGTYMSWMAASGHAHGGTSPEGVRAMPGMATSQEITKLRSLTGRELDVYFLQLMLRHHQGGLEMAQYAADHASTSQARTLGEKIVKGQSAEITLLTSMLAERGAKPL